MGESHDSTFSFDFNGSIRVEARGSSLSADGGAMLLRETEQKFHFFDDLAGLLDDPRDPLTVVHPMQEILRARIFAMALGYTDQDDLDFLRNDPALKIAVSERRGTSPLDKPKGGSVPDGLASQPTQSRLVRMLSSDKNLGTLNDFLFTMAQREWTELGRSGPVVLDIDSFPIEVFGSQPGSNYSALYHMRCFSGLVTMLSSTAGILRADLREGSTYTAKGAVQHLEAVLNQATDTFGRVDAVRGDAGYPSEPFFSFIEARDIHYVLRLKGNQRLFELALPYLCRPPGRPPKEPRIWFHEIDYAAGTWSRKRRVVLVVLERPGDLFLDHFFLVTNYEPSEMTPETLLDFYRERGTMEQHLGEFKSVLSPALSSTPRQKSHYRNQKPETRTPPIDGAGANEATFLLFLLGYNLMNLVRNLTADTLAAEEPVPSLARVRIHVLKVAVRVTRSARYAYFVMNQTYHEIWGTLLERISRIECIAQIE